MHSISLYGLGLGRLLVVCFLTLTGTSGHAETGKYPEKPIKVVMPWNDGFPANSTRLFSEALGGKFRKSVFVDLRSGAGGEVAAKQVMVAPDDGYTLLAAGSSITIRGVMDDKNADGLRDLQPIAQLVTSPYVVVATTGKFGSFQAFIAAAKSSPGKLNYASAGVGTGMHYLGELINYKAGIRTVHVPYASGARQLQALLSGDVDVAIISLVTAAPQIRAGTLEALAVSTSQRSKVAPQIPTFAESGLKDIPSTSAWIALFGPKGLDPRIVKELAAKVQEVSDDAGVRATVASWGGELPDPSTAALVQVLKSEKTLWTNLLANHRELLVP